MCGISGGPFGGGMASDRFGSRWIDDEDDGQDLGAELLEEEIVFASGGTIEFSVADNAGCFEGLDFIGDVGRDPIADGRWMGDFYGIAND